MDDVLAFVFGFAVNGGVALALLRNVYVPSKRDKDYVLMFLTFNTLAFLIAGLLGEVDLGVGLGLGLFAIFSILRFRTDPIPIREMTYLFAMMALPVVNALLLAQEAYASLAIANLAVAGALSLIERGWGLRNTGQKTLTYERIEWIKPEYAQSLLADLVARTGLDITHFEVGKIDFLHDTAEIKITYTEPQDQAPLRSTGSPADYTTLFSNKRG